MLLAAGKGKEINTLIRGTLVLHCRGSSQLKKKTSMKRKKWEGVEQVCGYSVGHRWACKSQACGKAHYDHVIDEQFSSAESTGPLPSTPCRMLLLPALVTMNIQKDHAGLCPWQGMDLHAVFLLAWLLSSFVFLRHGIMDPWMASNSLHS